MTIVMSKTIPAGKFKATCLKLMDQVKRNRETLIVTKNGVPIIKIVPADELPSENILGCMKETVKIVGDILEPITSPLDWEANRS